MSTRKTVVIFHDFLMASLAWQLAWWIRFNLEFPYYNWQLSLYTLPLIVVVQGLVFHRFRLHLGLWRFASLPDLWNIFRAAVFGVLCISVVLFIAIRLEGIPRSILLLYPILLIFLLGGPRLAYRVWKDRTLNLKVAPGGQKVLIVGAGRAGEMLVREMLRDGSYIPIGFVDDNPLLKGSEVHGIRVLGTVDDLTRITQARKIDVIVIAVPAATNEQMQRIVSRCEEATIPLRTLPKIQDMMSGKVTLGELHEVSIEDLLGRDKVELDWQIISQGLTNKVVMVSGGGGSIGSELCAQISRLNPSVLVIFERNEFSLYNIQRLLLDTKSSLKVHAILGDLCDRSKVDHVLSVHKPDVIFHAAAYKHVPLLQNQSREAVRNNVLGTRNLAESAIAYGCAKFVFISTDKAVHPANVLGASKRIAEMYCEWMNQQAKTRFITVRFGNVLGSDGSVIPLFREQIKKGGPVTVTHPDISRFFMTIREACQLILQVGAMGKGGEIYVLDMGDPIKISYLAEQMIRLSGFVPGEDIMITYTGLRPGEKMFEELFYGSEIKELTDYPKILLARHPGLDWTFLADRIEELEQACNIFDEERLKSLLDQLTPVSGNRSQQQDKVIPLTKGTR